MGAAVSLGTGDGDGVDVELGNACVVPADLDVEVGTPNDRVSMARKLMM